MRYKKLVNHVESHASAVSLLERAENSAISEIINQSVRAVTGWGTTCPALLSPGKKPFTGLVARV